jgi:ABC-2 type transport system permease protein
MLRTALLVAGKDLRQRLRDRSALVIAFVAPFVLASIIGLAFGGDTAFTATYAVADADRGPVAAGFTDGVLASPGLRDLITVRQVEPGEARALVDRNQVDAAFLLPAGLSAAVQQGRPAALTVVESGQNPVAGQVAQSLAEAYAAELAATRLAVATALDASGRAPTEAEARRLGERAAAQAQPVQLVEGRTGGRTIEPANYFGPSMAIFFLFFTVSFGARSILAERRQGTLRRLLASAAPPGGVLAGKALAAFTLGTASMLVMWLATTLVFGVDWGDPPAALLLTVTFALVATGVGMLGGSVLRNAEQATSIGPPVGIALGMLGGCMWPLAIVPEPMRVVGHLFPQAWAMDAFIALIARNTGLGGILRELAVLAAFAAVLLGLAVWRLRRTLVG